MFWTGLIRRNKRNAYFGLGDARQLNFCLFCRVLQTLHRLAVAFQVDSLLFFELLQKPLNQNLVKIIAAEVSVAVCSQNFKNPVSNFQNRNVKSSATQIVNQNLFIGLFIKSICKRGSRRLVDYSFNFESSNLTCFFCCVS